MNFDIDLFIVAGYLALMLVVGIAVSRNVKTMKDYSVANHTFSNGIMMITMIATVFGGASTIGFAENIYSQGLIMLVANTGWIFAYLFMGYFIAPNMGKYTGLLSVGDIMHKHYGMPGKLITGVLGFIFCIAIVAAQCKAMGYLLNATFGIDPGYAILFGASILIIYSSFGGIKSVTITDVIQFAILIVIIPLIANIAVTKIGGVEELYNKIPSEKFSVFDHPRFWEFFVISILYGAFPAFSLGPAPVQRMLMTKNTKIISNMYYVCALVSVPFEIMVALTGFTAFVLFPEISPGLALPTVINEMLPTIIRGFAITGVLAVIMSTADSFLNSGAILLVHDIIKPLSRKSYIPELKLTKFTTFFMGLTAIILATTAGDIITLAFFAVSLWGPVMVIPLVCGILGFNCYPEAFYKSAIITIAIFILGKIFMPAELSYWIGLICISANAICFFTITKFSGKLMPENPLPIINNFTKKPFKFTLLDYINTSIKHEGSMHVLFGIFCCLNYIIPYFMWTQGSPNHYNHMLGLRLTCGILCMILLTKPYWNAKLSKYFGLYWYFTLMVCLPFSTTVIASIQGFDTEWLINLALAIFLLSLLVNWLSFIAIMTFGSIAGTAYFKFFFPQASVVIPGSNLYLAIYIVFFSSLIGLIFSRKRDDLIAEKINFLQNMSGMLAHEVKTPLAGISGVRDMYRDILNKAKVHKNKGEITIKLSESDYKMLKQIPGLIGDSLHKGEVFIETFTSAIETEVPDQEKGLVSLKDCVNKALATFEATKKHRGKLHVKLAGDHKFIGSAKYTMHAILNILLNAVKHGGNDVDIWVKMAGSKLEISNNGAAIPENILPDIFDRTFSTGQSSGLGLSFAQMVFSDLGGSIECLQKHDKTTFLASLA